jgi:triosephosphate isomerase
LSDGFELGKSAEGVGIRFYILTATSSDEMQKYLNGQNFCTVDETTLKSMVRANPGYMLLKDGVIEGKWSWATVPDKDWFGEIISANRGKINNSGAGAFTVISVIAVLLLILIILGFNIKRYTK